MAKTLTPAQCTALRTGTGRAATLAVLVRLELMDADHKLTRAGRNIRATLDNGAPTLEHVAFVVREIAGVNWNAPQTFWINKPGARSIAEGEPLFHNGSAVSVVWHPSTEDAYVYAGTDVVAFRHGVQDLHMVDAAEWARASVASATPAAPIVTNEGTPVINAFVDDANGRNVTCLALARATAVPMLDYLSDAGYRVSHDGWYSSAEMTEQRDCAASPVLVPAVDTPAPLTEWQRRERFATMRSAGRKAAGLREEAEYMAHFPREYDAQEVRNAKTEADQWAHLSAWLGQSVRRVSPLTASGRCTWPTGLHSMRNDVCTRCGKTDA